MRFNIGSGLKQDQLDPTSFEDGKTLDLLMYDENAPVLVVDADSGQAVAYRVGRTPALPNLATIMMKTAMKTPDHQQQVCVMVNAVTWKCSLSRFGKARHA